VTDPSRAPEAEAAAAADPALSTAHRPALVPDPDKYDSPRAVRARAKGLPGPYIAGGDDPDIGAALEVDRRYGRLLVYMVLTIVSAGFIIGTIIALIGPTSGG
jgi:hypothetical protein